MYDCLPVTTWFKPCHFWISQNCRWLNGVKAINPMGTIYMDYNDSSDLGSKCCTLARKQLCCFSERTRRMFWAIFNVHFTILHSIFLTGYSFHSLALFSSFRVPCSFVLCLLLVSGSADGQSWSPTQKTPDEGILLANESGFRPRTISVVTDALVQEVDSAAWQSLATKQEEDRYFFNLGKLS